MTEKQSNKLLFYNFLCLCETTVKIGKINLSQEIICYILRHISLNINSS